MTKRIMCFSNFEPKFFKFSKFAFFWIQSVPSRAYEYIMLVYFKIGPTSQSFTELDRFFKLK